NGRGGPHRAAPQGPVVAPDSRCDREARVRKRAEERRGIDMTQPQTLNETPAQGALADGGEFAALLTREFKPQSDRAREEVESAVRTLAEQALAGATLTSSDAVQNIQSIIAELDRKLSAQINQIVHHPDFQALEGSWRGLHHLVNNSE